MASVTTLLIGILAMFAFWLGYSIFDSYIVSILFLIVAVITGKSLQLELLRLHHFGQAKYAALGRHYPIENLPPVADETISFMENLLAKSGIIIIKS